MSPALVKQVISVNGSNLLEGQRQKTTVLFSDIRSFTSIVETIAPNDVVALLNTHFSDAVNIIYEEQGVLDKFIGDAVMAVFGIPFVQPDDAIHACRSALKMLMRLKILNEKRHENNESLLRIGIGINTGDVISGNIGSVKRMEYTVIGDAVNLASRCESLTSYYGVNIIITENTLIEIGDAFIIRELDTVIVKGKSIGVKIYELVAFKDVSVLDYPPNHRKCHELFAEALSLYRLKRFEDALLLFRQADDQHDDLPCKIFVKRCEQFIQSSPSDDWDGTFIATFKS
jgi:adenylate cyclase